MDAQTSIFTNKPLLQAEKTNKQTKKPKKTQTLVALAAKGPHFIKNIRLVKKKKASIWTVLHVPYLAFLSCCGGNIAHSPHSAGEGSGAGWATGLVRDRPRCEHRLSTSHFFPGRLTGLIFLAPRLFRGFRGLIIGTAYSVPERGQLPSQ